MTPFYFVCNSAKDGQLMAHPHADYLASSKFRERIEFEGARGEQDMVNITLYLLERLALRGPDMLTMLASGSILPDYFQVSNPVPKVFNVRVENGSPTYFSLKSAIIKNLNSPMTKARIRVQKWQGREFKYLNAIQRAAQAEFESRVPKRVNYHTAEDIAVVTHRQELMAEIRDRFDNLAYEAAQRRQARLRLFGDAACPGLVGKNYYDLLTDIAVDVLM